LEECGEVDGRCWVLVRSLGSEEVLGVSSLSVGGVDASMILVDRSAARIRGAVAGLVDVEIRHFSVQSRWASLPLLDPFASSSTSSQRVNVLDSAHMDLVFSSSRKAQLQAQLQASPVQQCPDFSSHLTLLTRFSKLSDRVTRLRASLDESNLGQMSDYHAKVDLLQRLDYIDGDLQVQLKGRVACELNTCDSIIGTELIFNNAIGDLTPQETLALLSCLLFRERVASVPALSDRLSLCVDRVHSTCQSLASLALQCGQEVEVAEFVRDNANPALMEVVHAWADQLSFVEICGLTDVLEGSIVRHIQRIEETCKDIQRAAQIIGDQPLHTKITNAAQLIRRDIVFAASLYVS